MTDQSPAAVVPKRRRRGPPWLLPLALIVLGVGLVGFFGTRAVRSFREVQYIRDQGLDSGTARVAAIRGWMTLRFVAVAYAVPEEYLYDQLGVAFEKRNPNQTLAQLNRIAGLNPPSGGELPVVTKVQDAISAYRANPVVTGLNDIRPWMSVRYIANSTGVSEEQLFAAIGVTAAGNESKPLDLLAKETNRAGGPPALVDAIKAVVPTSGKPDPGGQRGPGGKP